MQITRAFFLLLFLSLNHRAFSSTNDEVIIDDNNYNELFNGVNDEDVELVIDWIRSKMVVDNDNNNNNNNNEVDGTVHQNLNKKAIIRQHDDTDIYIPAPAPAPVSIPYSIIKEELDGLVPTPVISDMYHRGLQWVPLPGGGCGPIGCCTSSSCFTYSGGSYPSGPSRPSYSPPTAPTRPSPSYSSPSQPSYSSSNKYPSQPSPQSQNFSPSSSYNDMFSYRNSKDDNDGLSGAAIAGIVIGVLVGIGGIVTAVIFLVFCRKKGNNDNEVTKKQTKTDSEGDVTSSPQEDSHRVDTEVGIIKEDESGVPTVITTTKNKSGMAKEDDDVSDILTTTSGVTKIVKKTIYNADNTVRSVDTKMM